MIKTFADTVGGYFKRTDKLIWILTISASVYGFFLIASQQQSGGPDFLKTQVIAVFLGYLAAVFISLADYKTIAKFWWFIAGTALAMTFSVFFIGIQVSGTDDAGWINLPGGATFQPSELTKICFIVTYSKHLAVLSENGRLRSFCGVVSLLLHAMIPIVLIHIQGDDGAVLVFAMMFIIMSFIAGVQLRYFIIILSIVIASIPVSWSSILNSDQKNRLSVLFSSDDETLRNYGWQQYQGKISIASGGFFGKGFFKGPRVRKGIVPFQENDLIFTVAGEELGFIGCLAIILLFAFMLIRILMISLHTHDPLGRNICVGFFSLVGVEVIINLGMVLGLLPVIGITLPFFSSGGTSVACLYLGVGLVQSVYMHPALVGERPLNYYPYKVNLYNS